MRRRVLSTRPILIASLLVAWHACAVGAPAQTPSLLPAEPPKPPAQPATPPGTPARPTSPSSLPDAPEPSSSQVEVVSTAEHAFACTGDPLPAGSSAIRPLWMTAPHQNLYAHIAQKRGLILRSQRFLNEEVFLPMTPRQKAYIAVTNFTDPGNLAVIAFSSAIYVATTPYSPYGPGLRGFGTNYGYSLSQAATGEFFGTWAIPSLFHQDLRYHRMPGAPIRKRILHAVAHTVIAQSDTGHTIPNYATLLTYPISAAIANVYVPGLERNVPATTQRVLIGLATDPSDALIGEFLPDVARRIHIRVTFFQRVINDYSTDRP